MNHLGEPYPTQLKSSSKDDFSREDLAHEQVHLQQQFQQTKKSPKKRRSRTQPDRYRPLPNSPLSFRAQRMHIPKVGEKKLKTNTGPKRNLSMLATKNPTKKSSPKKYVKAPAPAKKKKKKN